MAIMTKIQPFNCFTPAQCEYLLWELEDERRRDEDRLVREAAIEQGLSSEYWLTGPKINLVSREPRQRKPYMRERWEHVHRLWERHRAFRTQLEGSGGPKSFWKIYPGEGDWTRRRARMKLRNPWNSGE